MRNVLAVLLVCSWATLATADSLMTRAVAERGSLISNKQVQFKEGDIIKVLVEETVDASTAADTDTKKESEVTSEADENDNAFIVSPRPNGYGLLPKERLPNWSLETENEHKTQGTTRRSNKLTMTVACSVTKVFENGNVALEGEKKVTINREDSMLHVSGVARGSDVTATNTVKSEQLADAVIELKGCGPLWNNQRRGLVTRFLDWFSPF